MNWTTVIVTVVIPFIVQALKKWIPVKFAPIVAIALAGIYVIIAKLTNNDADFNTVYAAIATALGVAGVSALGYDTVKSLTAPPAK